MTKTQEIFFCDWEAYVFGFGYGSGEPHVIPEVRRFFMTCKPDGAYNYQDMETQLSPPVAWMMINALCHAGVIEYGTSPRFGWLTKEGKKLREFVCAREPEELLDLLGRNDEAYAGCSPRYCNCGPDGYEEGRICENPFFPARMRRAALAEGE